MRTRFWLAAVAAVSIAVVTGGAPRARSAVQPAPRWTDRTPDAMIDDAVTRVLDPSSPEHEAAAGIAIVAALADRATFGHAADALARVAATPSGIEGGLRGDASLLARSLATNEGTEEGGHLDHHLGVAQHLAILGPFRDNGGGLDAKDGPEIGGLRIDPTARYSWGSYEVKWRPVPTSFAGARGVPLDLLVFPRKESCVWVATTLAVKRARPVFVSAAATGQIRLSFDGKDVARDEEVHASARFDRVAARVSADAGEHVLAAKVCSGALEDDGRVRLRVTDESEQWPDDVTETAHAAGAASWARALAQTELSTPLSRALQATRALSAARPRAASKDDAASNREGDDALLDSAILRTLGGADDLRSPRAPGILSGLADGPLDPDRLAMVAWIAPSSANRGAWLLRARARADERTRAFVDRRLVERHLDAHLSDWAMIALRTAKLDPPRDDEAAWLAARVDLSLGNEALRIRALHSLASAAKASPHGAPDVLLALLADVSEGLDPATAVVAREELAARGQIGADGVRTMVSAKGSAEAIQTARRAFARGAVEDAEDALGVVEALAKAGDHTEALRLYQELAGWAPNRAAVWAGLAHEMEANPRGEVEDPASDAPSADPALAPLRRARELDPGESRYRAELALRARSPNLDAETRDDEKYLVSSPVILARRQGVAAAAASLQGPSASSPAALPAGDFAEPLSSLAPDVADRELHWLRAVVMHADRRVSELVHYAREIVIPPRTEDELYESIPAEGDLTEILRARVHRKDGGTAFPVEEANDGERPRIRWPDLFPGDVVEVAFRSWTAGPVGGRGDPPFYRLDYAGAFATHPVLYNEVVVDAPAERPIYVDVIRGKADQREERDEGGRHILRLVWQKPVNVPDEPLAPQLSEVVPTVVLSTFKDWSAFRGWYAEAVHGFTEPDAQVRDLAARLTLGKTSQEEKVRAVFDFVADDIRYVNYVSGEWWLPNRPQQLLARREGDCDDKAILLITLLKAVGIQAQEVMVQTRLTDQPSVLRAPGVAVPLFDHGIAFLPGPHGGTYLDATSPQSRLGPLPSMDARAVALRLDGPAEVVELPASSPEDHGIESSWTLRLAADGSADLDGEERASGDDAFWMRTYLTEPGARAQWVEDRLVGPWFSTVQVDKKVEFRGDLPHGTALVRWHAHSEGLARREGTELVVPLSPSQTLASQLAPLVRRTLPVELPPHIAPRKESRRLRIVAPPGWSFEPLAPSGEANGGAFGHARLELAQDPRDPSAVTASRTVVFDQSAIPVEAYPKWRAWVQSIDALMHRAVRLAPAGDSR